VTAARDLVFALRSRGAEGDVVDDHVARIGVV
jgi:hypothetical protein